jgi:hypothetical protein
MKPSLNGRVDRLEQQNGCGRPKRNIREYSDHELDQILATGLGVSIEYVQNMSEAELEQVINGTWKKPQGPVPEVR